MLKSLEADRLRVKVYKTREEAGEAAGAAILEQMRRLFKIKSEIRMIFAAAPSQNETLDYLVLHKDETEWKRVTAFHMDEYTGLEEKSEQLFSFYLNKRLFDHLPLKKIHLINSQNEEETKRYSSLINEEKIDIVCLGIGENGHLAFNDPPVADFNDPETAKIVELDLVCRRQQVNDGCFPSIKDVPKKAITLTIPSLLKADYLFCVVPGKSKHEAVRKTLEDPLSENCPSTILRTHQNCTLFLDSASYTNT